MKLFSSFLLFMTLFSCGPLPEENTGGAPGEDREFLPLKLEDGSQLKAVVETVCAALEEKERNLIDYVGRDQFRFSYGESQCGSDKEETKNIDVKIIRESGRYEFAAISGSFGMPEVETRNSGVMRELCLGLGNLHNPMQTYPGSSTAVEFRTMETNNCRNTSQEACLVVMRGRISGNRYKVTENTLISFLTAPGNKSGFYQFKSVKSYGSCPDGKFRKKTVRLL